MRSDYDATVRLFKSPESNVAFDESGNRAFLEIKLTAFLEEEIRTKYVETTLTLLEHRFNHLI